MLFLVRDTSLRCRDDIRGGHVCPPIALDGSPFGAARVQVSSCEGVRLKVSGLEFRVQGLGCLSVCVCVCFCVRLKEPLSFSYGVRQQLSTTRMGDTEPQTS